MASLVILDKDSNELQEIDLKIQDDGLRGDLIQEHKLRHLWRCWQRSESSLKSALEDVEALRRQHAEEMIEVENYVSHIRQLSEEREALTFEFEAENEQLKAELEELKLERDSGMFSSEELSKLFADKGHRAYANLPVKEQITQLINALAKDNEKLLELEAENQNLKAEGNSISSKMLEIMDAERADMEREVTRMKEQLRVTKEEDKTAFEKEITEVKEEKANLQNQVNEAESRIKNLLSEAAQLNRNLEDEKDTHKMMITKLKEEYEEKLILTLEESKEAQQKDNLKQKAQMKTLQCEVNSLREQLSAVMDEKKSLKDMINQLEEDLWAEKQHWDTIYQESETALREEREKLTEKEKELVTAERKEAELQGANSHLEDLLCQANKELEEAKRKEGDETLKQKTDNDQLNSKVNDLSREKRALNIKVKKLEGDLDQKQDTIQSLQKKLQEKEQVYKDSVLKANKRDQKNRNEISAIRKKMAETETSLETAKRERELLTTRYEETVSMLKIQETSYQEKLEIEKKKSNRLEVEMEQMQQEIADLRQRMEEQAAQQSSKDQMLSTEINSISKEKEELAMVMKVHEEAQRQKDSEISSYQEQTKQLTEERQSLEQSVKVQEEKNEEIKEQLMQMQTEEIEYKSTIDKMTDENNQLSRQLSRALSDFEESLSKAEVLQKEVADLRDELNHAKSSSLNAQATLQQTVNELQQTLHETKEKEYEQHSLTSKDLNKVKEENFEMKTVIKELEKEISDHRLELSTVEEVNKELRTKSTEGESVRMALEAKLEIVEQELVHANQQVNNWSTDAKDKESTKTRLEKDLEEKQKFIQKLESTIKEKQLDNTTLSVERDTLNSRINMQERQISSLNGEVETLRDELQRSTLNLEETMKAEVVVQQKANEITTLRKSLDEENVNRLVLTDTIKELESQVMILEQDRAEQVDKYNRLNLLVSAKEESFVAIRRHQKDTVKQHSNVENHAKDLQGKVEHLQIENSSLKSQLSHEKDALSTLQRKYDERKIQTYTKLQALRERYTREKKAFETLISQLQNNLSISQSRLEKEIKWKTETEECQKGVLEEKNFLTTKLLSLEEELRDSNRDLRQMRTRQGILVEEKNDLTRKLELGLRERQNLERCLRELIEREMFGTAHRRSDLSDSRFVIDAYLNMLKPGAGLGRRPSPGPGEPNVIRRGPDGRGAPTNFSLVKQGSGSDLPSPGEEFT